MRPISVFQAVDVLSQELPRVSTWDVSAPASSNRPSPSQRASSPFSLPVQPLVVAKPAFCDRDIVGQDDPMLADLSGGRGAQGDEERCPEAPAV